jgi:hypothetical protein
MSAVQLSCLLLALLAAATALAAIPASPVRLPLIVACGAMLVSALVLFAIGGNQPSASTSQTGSPASPTHASPTESSAPASSSSSASAAAPSSFAQVSLGVPSSSLTAYLYFGQLHAIVNALHGKVSFNVPADLLTSEPNACADTVVFFNVPNGTGTVSAYGLGTGWGGAENPPSQSVEQHNLHQQLVTPPTKSTPGQRWEVGEQLHTNEAAVTSDSYILILQGKTASTSSWLINGSKRVTCGL